MATALLLGFLSLGSAREVVATKEWQAVGENDTIPAGMHVRMDLTTGGRWVKIIDENDDDEGKQAAGGTDTVEIQDDGSVYASKSSKSSSSMAVVAQPEEDDSTKSQVKSKKEPEPKFDYDMMHRTLSNLPDEEQERMGGLPELPGGSASSASKITDADRKLFEIKMKDLWDRRQAELADLQDDMMMDMPKVLQDRIQRLQAYLDDPHAHLLEVVRKDKVKAAAIEEQEDEQKVTDISSVLLDLEYQLADVDMARDFHTMGGWPLLATLLSNDAHTINHNATSIEKDEIANIIHQVQLQAAWAIGTAVKNTGEFYPYATEEMTLQDGKGTKATALELLLQQLTISSTLGDSSSMVKKKRQKIVYAMGGLLRGNRVGQIYFLSIDGPDQLSNELQGLLDSSRTSSDMSLVKRILALAGDIVSDVILHEDQDDHKTIVDAFSSKSYCQSCLDSLNGKNEFNSRGVKETAVRTLQALAPFCHEWDKEAAALTVVKVKQAWQVEPEMDHEVRRELLDLASDTVDRIRQQETTV